MIQHLQDILQWAACFTLLEGLRQIGNKRIAGFYIALTAEVMWIAWGVWVGGAWALVAMSAVICVMYVRAIRLWGAPT